MKCTIVLFRKLISLLLLTRMMAPAAMVTMLYWGVYLSASDPQIGILSQPAALAITDENGFDCRGKGYVLDFGLLSLPDQPLSQRTLYVRNDGMAPVQIDFQFSGRDQESFSLLVEWPMVNASTHSDGVWATSGSLFHPLLWPGSIASVRITYQPHSEGVTQASLQVKVGGEAQQIFLQAAAVDAFQLQKVAFLKAPNADREDQFGRSVAVSGKTLVVGAPYEQGAHRGETSDLSDNSVCGAGAVYVYEEVEGIWQQQAYLKADEATPGLGLSVDLEDDWMVAGGYGKVVIFHRQEGRWRQDAILHGESSEDFGEAVAISQNHILIGAKKAMVAGKESAGAAYVYVRDVDAWRLQARLTASHPDAGDQFGTSVDIDEEWIVIGAPWEDGDALGVDGEDDNNRANAAGAVYVFRNIAELWQQECYLKPISENYRDLFGIVVKISNQTIFASNSNQSSRGVVGFAYRLGTWQNIFSQQAPGDTNHGFGFSLALVENLLLIGDISYTDSNDSYCPTEIPGEWLNPTGGFHVYRKIEDQWLKTLQAFTVNRIRDFAYSLATDGQFIFAGAPYDDSYSTLPEQQQFNLLAPNSGAVLIFNQNTDLSPKFLLEESTGLATNKSIVVSDAVVGKTATPHRFIIRNDGTAPLVLHSVSLTGDDASHFHLDTDCLHRTLPPFTWTFVAVHFQPKSRGEKNAQLVVHSNDPHNPLETFALTGYGRLPYSLKLAAEWYYNNNQHSFSMDGNILFSNNQFFAFHEEGGWLSIGKTTENASTTYNLLNRNHLYYGSWFVSSLHHGENKTISIYPRNLNLPERRIYNLVAFSGEYLAIVGEYYDNDNYYDVAFFTESDDYWRESSKLNVNKEKISQIAMSEDILAIQTEIGVEIFGKTDHTWELQAIVNPFIPSNCSMTPPWASEVNFSLAISGNSLAIGNPNDYSNAFGINGNDKIWSEFTSNRGSVTVYTRQNGVWNRQAYIKTSLPSMNELFGKHLSLSGDHLIVAAPPSDPGAGQGLVYLFAREENRWVEQAILDVGSYFPENSEATTDTLEYPAQVNICDDFIVISGKQLSTAPTAQDSFSRVYRIENLPQNPELVILDADGKELHSGCGLLSFSTVQVGNASPPYRVQLRNQGNSELTGLSHALKSLPGACTNPFHVDVHSFPATLAAGEVREVIFSFEPNCEGRHLANLVITSDDWGARSVSILLEGFGAIPPQILNQPESVTSWTGWEACFSVSAMGTLPLHYIWRKDGREVSELGLVDSATEGDFCFTTQPWSRGNYRVEITNAVGLAISSPPTVDAWTYRFLASKTVAGHALAPGGNPCRGRSWPLSAEL